MRNATDYEILKFIYNEYYNTYIDFEYNGENNKRKDKNYVPIDIDHIAERMGIEGDLIFGRLYYHLNHKFSYEHEDGVRVDFFANMHAKQKHCIQFPYLASALADLEEQRKNYRINLGLLITTVASVLVAILAIIFSNSGNYFCC